MAKRKPTSLILAHYDSRNFSFDGIGATKDEAYAALLDAFRAHGKAYECAPDWFVGPGLPEDVDYRTLVAGCGYRDGEQISGRE